MIGPLSRSWCDSSRPAATSRRSTRWERSWRTGCATLGGAVEIIPNAARGDHVLGRFPGPAERRPALVLGHFDTVWPRGTLERMPFRVDGDGRAFGPGVFDMKASLVIFLAVMEQLEQASSVAAAADLGACSPPTRRSAARPRARSIEELARRVRLRPGARAGPGRRRAQDRRGRGGPVPPRGRGQGRPRRRRARRTAAARSSSSPTRSCSSRTLQDLAAGTTLNVGVIQGGTTANVVPAQASAEIDVRVASQAEEPTDRRGASRARVRSLPAYRLTVSGSFNRPPMERTPAIAALFEQARRIGRRARPRADRGLDRRRQRRQLHRGAGRPDPRRPGRARRRRPCRRRAHPDRLAPGAGRSPGCAPARIAGRIMTQTDAQSRSSTTRSRSAAPRRSPTIAPARTPSGARGGSARTAI